MKIKEEYKGKTIITYDSILGQRRVEVDQIDLKKFAYYTSIGLGYIFETENVTISYKGIEEEVKPATKTRKRKPNVTTD